MKKHKEDKEQEYVVINCTNILIPKEDYDAVGGDINIEVQIPELHDFFTVDHEVVGTYKDGKITFTNQ